MKSIEPSPLVFTEFSALFRKQVHLLIALGYQESESRIRSSLDEEAITGFLFHAIRNITRFSSEGWCLKYDVYNEMPIPGGGRIGRSRKQTDLIIMYVYEGKPEFVFEAKPLNYNKSYQREKNYVDKDGLQRFIIGEYADYTSRFPEAGMLGYVLSDQVEEWRERLKAAIEKDKLILRLKSAQSNIKVTDELAVEWVSEHDRDTAGNSITVYHILLDCCCLLKQSGSKK